MTLLQNWLLEVIELEDHRLQTPFKAGILSETRTASQPFHENFQKEFTTSIRHPFPFLRNVTKLFLSSGNLPPFNVHPLIQVLFSGTTQNICHPYPLNN